MRRLSQSVRDAAFLPQHVQQPTRCECRWITDVVWGFFSSVDAVGPDVQSSMELSTRRCLSVHRVEWLSLVDESFSRYRSCTTHSATVQRTTTDVVADPKRTPPPSPPTRRFNFRSIGLPVKRTVTQYHCPAIISRRSVAKLTHARRPAFCCHEYCDQRAPAFRVGFFYHLYRVTNLDFDIMQHFWYTLNFFAEIIKCETV